VSALPASRRWEATLAHLPVGRGGGADVRSRAVHDLAIEAGRVTARVAEARGPGGTVRLSWATPTAAAWGHASARLAERARWTAVLLDGLPDADLERELADVGVVLIPADAELVVECSCGGPRWCVHARALHRAVGTAIARDPWLLLRLAGGSREALLADVRVRAGTSPATVADQEPAGPASGSVGAEPHDPASIPLHPAPTADPGALIAHLGPPPGVEDLGPILRAVRDASAMAWRIAAGEGAGEADRTVLLAQLRAGRTMTAGELAAAVGADAAVVMAELEALHAAGAVLATGSGDRRRYRAP
jgi:hypothetical protein